MVVPSGTLFVAAHFCCAGKKPSHSPCFLFLKMPEFLPPSSLPSLVRNNEDSKSRNGSGWTHSNDWSAYTMDRLRTYIITQSSPSTALLPKDLLLVIQVEISAEFDLCYDVVHCSFLLMCVCVCMYLFSYYYMPVQSNACGFPVYPCARLAVYIPTCLIICLSNLCPTHLLLSYFVNVHIFIRLIHSQ